VAVAPHFTTATCDEGDKKTGNKSPFGPRHPLFPPQFGENLAAVFADLDDRAMEGINTVILRAFALDLRSPFAMGANESALGAMSRLPGVPGHTAPAADAPLEKVRFLSGPVAAPAAQAAVNDLPVVAFITRTTAAPAATALPGVLGVPHLAATGAFAPLPHMPDQAMEVHRLQVIAT